jgi:hypothetical protein
MTRCLANAWTLSEDNPIDHNRASLIVPQKPDEKTDQRCGPTSDAYHLSLNSHLSSDELLKIMMKDVGTVLSGLLCQTFSLAQT